MNGNVNTIDSIHSIIQGQDKFIAIVRIDNLLSIDSEDSILICSKDSTQDVKKVLENIKNFNIEESTYSYINDLE